jgi:hypothetical protein
MGFFYEDIAETYWYPAQNFGNSTITHNVIGPPGKFGMVMDIMADVTTAMVGTTTVPEIDVGTGSGDTSYARYRLGTAAGTGYGTGVHRARQESITGNPPPVLNDYSGHVALETAQIPANTAFVITLKAGTGGAPAGVADVMVRIKWF